MQTKYGKSRVYIKKNCETCITLLTRQLTSNFATQLEIPLV